MYETPTFVTVIFDYYSKVDIVPWIFNECQITNMIVNGLHMEEGKTNSF